LRVKAGLGGAVMQGYLTAIRMLPTGRAVRLKECMAFEGRMDYDKGDLVMTLETGEELIRLESCRKEPETVEWIEKHMRPGSVLYDIGANVGAYSLVACAHTRGRCCVYAFEPGFTTFATLGRNIIRNGYQDCIIPVQVALGERTSLAALEFSQLASGAARHRFVEGQAASAEQSASVLCYSLDEMAAQFDFDMPDMIKLDVDGTEMNVLRGAEKILTNRRLRTILVEVDRDGNADEIESFLAERGFIVASRNRHGRSSTFNYIFERQ
jgi:FkbM family methyltransferase